MVTAHSQNDITVEEAIALLKRTFLPTIVVEGCDDMIVYRTFEESLAHLGVSVFPVGGRKKVLEIFQRRSEIPLSVKLIFIADQDVWVNTGIPPEYNDAKMLFTHGYSIENDIYIDGELWKLLTTEKERLKHKTELEDFIEWYALALDRHLRDESHQISLHPDHVLDLSHRPGLLALFPTETYPVLLKDRITSDYKRLIRGKSLLALLLRNTSYKGRDARHNDKALLELVAVRPGPLLETMKTNVATILESLVP